MTTSKDLLLAILAMDSYNQGYGEGLKIDATQIGTATRIGAANGMPLDAATAQSWIDAGFYASSYTLTSAVGDLSAGTTIIS